MSPPMESSLRCPVRGCSSTPPWTASSLKESRLLFVVRKSSPVYCTLPWFFIRWLCDLLPMYPCFRLLKPRKSPMHKAARKTRPIGIPTSIPSLLELVCWDAASAVEVAESGSRCASSSTSWILGPERMLSSATDRRLRLRFVRDSPRNHSPSISIEIIPREFGTY